MTKRILMMAGILFAANTVLADYKCTDDAQELVMTVDENDITHFGDTTISITSPIENKQFFGSVQSDEGTLFKKKTFNLYSMPGDTLTITSKPKFCGRGSCEISSDPIIRAVLKIGEVQTFFFCDEINL